MPQYLPICVFAPEIHQIDTPQLDVEKIVGFLDF